MVKMIVFSVLCVFMFNSTVIAGPFGLKMGMKKEEISKLYGLDERDYIKKVPMPSNFFKTYQLDFSKKHGLCRIYANTGTFVTDVYGDEVKSRFDRIEAALNSKYGISEKFDFLQDGSIWNRSKDWTQGLTRKERYLKAFWSKTNNLSNLSDNLSAIQLVAVGINESTALLIAVYDFDNYDLCYNEIKEADTQGL